MKKDMVKILAIDDEADFVDVLKQYFGSRNYEIDISFTGDSGLALFCQKKHDVVLLDLKMADAGGDKLMRKIKEVNDASNVIIVTAFKDSGETRARLLNEGAYAYIEKPVASLKELEKLVRRAASNSEEDITE